MQVKELRRDKNLIVREYVFQGDEFRKLEDAAVNYLNSLKVEIDGFRPGKVPKEVLKRRLKDDFYDVYVTSEAQEVIKNELRKEQELELLLPPFLVDTKFGPGEGLFTIELHTVPNIEIDLGTIEFEKFDLEKFKKEQAANLKEAYISEHATLEPKDGPAEYEDQVVFDERVYKDGRLVREKFEIEFILTEDDPSKLSERFVGKKEGDTFSFEKVFQRLEDDSTVAYNYEIFVRKVYKRILPEINDEFVKSLSIPGVESVEDFERYLELEAEEIGKLSEERFYIDQLQEHLIELSRLDISDETLERFAYEALEKLEDDAYQKLVKRFGSEESLIEYIKEERLKNLKKELALERLAKEYNLRVELNEIAEAIARRDPEFNISLDRLEVLLDRNPRVKRSWEMSLLTKKLVDVLSERGVIVYREPNFEDHEREDQIINDILDSMELADLEGEDEEELEAVLENELGEVDEELFDIEDIETEEDEED